MTWERRVLLREVMGDQAALPEVQVAAWHLDKLVRCDEVLSWFIKNRLTGKRFLEFLREHQGLVLEVASEVLRRLDREAKRRPIIHGRDYLG